MLYTITGLAGSGKDTVGQAIVKNGFADKIYNFGDPIKKILANTFSLQLERFLDPVQKRISFKIYYENINPTYFELWCRYYQIPVPKSAQLAALLTELIKRLEAGSTNIGGPYWERNKPYFTTNPRRMMQIFGTDLIRGSIDDEHWIKIAPPDNIVNPSIRFLNEYQWAVRHQAIKFLIVRPGIVAMDHASEDIGWAQDVEFDHYIINNGTVPELEAKIIIALLMK